MIVYLRTASIPAEWRERYLAWIEDGRAIRQQHGILAELVCQPSIGSDNGGDADWVVNTVWPSHDDPNPATTDHAIEESS